METTLAQIIKENNGNEKCKECKKMTHKIHIPGIAQIEYFLYEDQ
jgi:hypothetical protein